MMKKLLSYALPLAAAAGITGCKPEFPAATIEKAMYGELENGVETCLYDETGEYRGSGSGEEETGFGLYLRIKLQDPDKIKSHTSSWSGVKPTDGKCRYEAERSLTVVSPRKSLFENMPLVYKVTDCKGNAKEYKFTLDDIIKNSKPFRTLRPKEGKCPKGVDHPRTSLNW